MQNDNNNTSQSDDQNVLRKIWEELHAKNEAQAPQVQPQARPTAQPTRPAGLNVQSQGPRPQSSQQPQSPRPYTNGGYPQQNLPPRQMPAVQNGARSVAPTQRPGPVVKQTAAQPTRKVLPVLSIQNLTKKYGSRIAANNVSLNVYAGQIIGFLGANGAGKSTTIKMLTGLAHITSGEAYIMGHSIKSGFEQAIKYVGAMIEIPQFYNYLSGLNNLKFFAKLSGNVSTERINYVVSLVGLSNRIKDKVGSYSLGMKQRLGVAQALLNSPKLLILDEPTNGLDANGIREFRLMLKNLAYKEGIAILISSHILGEMENLCDMIAIIDKGKIIEVKSLDAIKHECKNAGSIYIKCNAPNFAGKLLMQTFGCKVKIQGKMVYIQNGSQDNLSQMIVALTRQGILVYGAGEVDYSLEDVFLTIINRNNQNTSIA